MKIAVYKVDSVKPKDENEYQDFCDILNLPTLKYGTAEFSGGFSHWVTKSELKKMSRVACRFYDRCGEFWRDGVLLTEHSSPKMFAQYAGKL